MKRRKRMCRGSHIGGKRESAEVRGDDFRISAREGSNHRARSYGPVLFRILKMGILVRGSFAIILAAHAAMGLFESCIHGGRKYEEGEEFTPNDTVIETETPNQCVQCRCLQGLVLCEIENCSSTECEAPVRNPRFCCLQCPGTLPVQKETLDFVFRKTETESILKKNSEGDCLSNGVSFKNGSVWQPVIGPFGVMACVQCRCLQGNIICTRLECPDLRCPRPRRELGQCCPVCPSSELNERKAFCLPKSSELFVFKTANVRNNSDRIEYAFLENGRKRGLTRVNVHTWNLRAKTLADVFSFSVITRQELLKRNFRILGSVSKRRFGKYSRREKKLRKNCLNKCFVKIGRLEHFLLDSAVSPRRKCSEDEVDVADI